jgi:hypothetical protein
VEKEVTNIPLRRRLPTAIEPKLAEKELIKKISFPLAEGNLHVCLQEVINYFHEIHRMESRNIDMDRVEIWCPTAVRVSSQLEDIGCDTMLKFCERSPKWYHNNLHNCGPVLMRQMAAAQTRFRNARHERKLDEIMRDSGYTG